MSATKPPDLILAPQKPTEGFTAIVDRPMDTDIIKIRQLLLPVLMKTKYDELTLTQNLLGVILPSKRNEHIYSNGAYLIPPVIAFYNDTIDKDAARIELHQAERKHESKRNKCALYQTADTSCNNSIMEVVNETWYKDLEDPDMFYTYVTALKILDHPTKFYLGLHTVDSGNIPQVIKKLCSDATGIPQFINTIEAVQQKPKQEKLVIHDKYMHTVGLKLLLQSGEYETETREWSKLPDG